MNKLNTKIKEFRQSRHYNQGDFAKLLKIAGPSLSDIENGKTLSFRVELLQNLIENTDITPFELWGMLTDREFVAPPLSGEEREQALAKMSELMQEVEVMKRERMLLMEMMKTVLEQAQELNRKKEEGGE